MSKQATMIDISVCRNGLSGCGTGEHQPSFGADDFEQSGAGRPSADEHFRQNWRDFHKIPQWLQSVWGETETPRR